MESRNTILIRFENDNIQSKLYTGNVNRQHKILRINGDEHLENFYKIINLKIIKDEIKPKYEEPLENDGKNIFWSHKMPNFKYSDTRWGIFRIYYDTKEDIEKLSKKLNITFINKSGWFPEIFKSSNNKKYWITNKNKIYTLKNKYPIYIISKGRWEKKLTYDAICELSDIENFKIVVETDEIEKYIEHGVKEEHILEFSKEDKIRISKEGDGGSIPVRNFIKEHSRKNNFNSYWCLDDNMNGFYRWYKNKRYLSKSGIFFRMVEEQYEKYSSNKMVGLNYLSFCPSISKRRELVKLNTRIYSCILISNDDEFYWRGTYNEDTDLSLRILKKGYTTMLFNNFLTNKQTTMSCKGGNTDTIYKEDGLVKKYQELYNNHSDCVKQTSKFNKEVHHQVNYKPFEKNELILNKNYTEPKQSLNHFKLKKSL